MVDRNLIGTKRPPHTAEVEKGRLRLFAKAIGETDPIYSDEEAARAAGHPSLPVPPTFLFSLNLERPNPADWIEQLNVPIAFLLHGEQEFEYQRLAYAGETLTFESEITDIYDKKGGALEFVVTETRVSDEDGQPVAKLTATTVIRDPGGG